jgi:hypothetical protein
MSRYEAVDYSTKETLKLGVELASVGLNCVAIACPASTEILYSAASALAAAVHTRSLAEKLNPSLKGVRPVFAVNPYEIYHIAHIANFLINSVALIYFAALRSNPLALFILSINVLFSRPVLHWGNSTLGYLHVKAYLKA